MFAGSPQINFSDVLLHDRQECHINRPFRDAQDRIDCSRNTRVALHVPSSHELGSIDTIPVIESVRDLQRQRVMEQTCENMVAQRKPGHPSNHAERTSQCQEVCALGSNKPGCRVIQDGLQTGFCLTIVSCL